MKEKDFFHILQITAFGKIFENQELQTNFNIFFLFLFRKLHTLHQLPDESSHEWYSHLSGTSPSVEEIRSAHEEFTRIGATSRYHYLCHYLKVNCLIPENAFCGVITFFSRISERC